MEKLKLYTVDTDYIKYLFSYDNRVMYWSNNSYKNARILYNQKAKGYENVHYLNSTIDFKLLEDACIRYEKIL